MSQGEWRGVPLCHLLSLTGIKTSALEALFEGYDSGKKPGYKEILSFKRSLPIPKALHSDTIIAYEFNGEPIPYRHGYPLRLIVPNWYAMTSVKWLKSISLIPFKFQGPFQTEDYVYYPDKENNFNAIPVTTINVDSIIQQPLNYQILPAGVHNIDGIAWTGEGKIIKVELSFDDGETWSDSNFIENGQHPYAWVFWQYKWEVYKKGEYKILSRAYDSAGRVQLREAKWNRKGYGYNAIYSINVKIQ